MADLGFNTCTFYGDAETTKRHMAAASEVGLLSEQPVLVLGEAPEATDHWCPEIIGYGPDEPRPEDGPAVRAAVKRWNALGKRCAAAVKRESLKAATALDECGGGKGWLDALIARVPSAFWEGTVAGEVPLTRPNMWDLHDTAEPAIDVAAEMRTAVRLLLAEKAGY